MHLNTQKLAHMERTSERNTIFLHDFRLPKFPLKPSRADAPAIVVIKSVISTPNIRQAIVPITGSIN